MRQRKTLTTIQEFLGVALTRYSLKCIDGARVGWSATRREVDLDSSCKSRSHQLSNSTCPPIAPAVIGVAWDESAFAGGRHWGSFLLGNRPLCNIIASLFRAVSIDPRHAV
jgi:hypothetical protein